VSDGQHGRAPDDLITCCREWLAEGELVTLARAVLFYVPSRDIAIAEDGALLLADLLAEYDADTSALASIGYDEFDPDPYYEFAREIPAELGDGETGPRLPARTAQQADQVAVQAVAALPGAIGLWRAWRLPADLGPWPPPKQVFLVEVGVGVDEIAVTLAVQERLAAAREDDPQVEVYQVGYQLSVYQELSRAYGELPWSVTEDPGIQIASPFDEVSPETGPSFRREHPRLEPDEVNKVAAYLYAGTPLLITETRMDDVLDTSRLSIVPMDFRTDGYWIWTDACAYYLETHQLEPDSRLLAHIRANDYSPPQVDGVAIYRALQVLNEPNDDELLWSIADIMDDEGAELEPWDVEPGWAPDAIDAVADQEAAPGEAEAADQEAAPELADDAPELAESDAVGQELQAGSPQNQNPSAVPWLNLDPVPTYNSE
jgi:hypothetical protein